LAPVRQPVERVQSKADGGRTIQGIHGGRRKVVSRSVGTVSPKPAPPKRRRRLRPPAAIDVKSLAWRDRHRPAQWQSGYAADCKSVYVGSIPACASRFTRVSSRLVVFRSSAKMQFFRKT